MMAYKVAKLCTLGKKKFKNEKKKNITPNGMVVMHQTKNMGSSTNEWWTLPPMCCSILIIEQQILKYCFLNKQMKEEKNGLMEL